MTERILTHICGTLACWFALLCFAVVAIFNPQKIIAALEVGMDS